MEFYIGRNGEFDEFAASVIKRVRKDVDLSNTALILVLPYNSAKIEDYEKYYDEITIPDVLWNLHPKGAIKKKNEWMVEQADLVIGYVEREEGGAYTALKYAKKLEKEVINLAEDKAKAEAEEQAREKKIQHAVLDIKKKFGKNAIVKGMNLEEGATAMDRNKQIGGHKA